MKEQRLLGTLTPERRTPPAYLGLVFITLLFFPPLQAVSADRCQTWAAKVVSVQGTVEVKLSQQRRWQPVRLNDTLCAGDGLRVQEFSRAAILLPNETVLRLDQGTVITFNAQNTESASWFDLLMGTLYSISRVPRSLQIGTPFVNAAIKGTEFLVRVEREQALVSVFEGVIATSNSVGSLIVNSRQTAIAARGQAPMLYTVVRPREAVQWALYYPPVIDPRPKDFPAAGPSIDAYRRGDLAGALASLGKVPERLRDTRFYTYRASLLLYVGRVEEAQTDIAEALRLDSRNGSAVALRAIVAIAQNSPDEARRLAEEAIGLDPRTAAPRIALSYAEQAGFELSRARDSVQEAVRLEPENALAWARLAELWLATGYLDRALKAASEAADLNPDLSRTQTILGYAYLAEFKVQEAQGTVERAIKLDQADPLPRLGLGLAKIRQGKLAEGRQDIEIAVVLDPTNSLIRSYLGKAYYDEKRDSPAATELDRAKALDPRDPTPWFYDAIRKQTTNRPVEALHDIDQAIELNDDRAVYRSRLLLDQDLAARSASLARIYRDLDFEQLGLVEGWKSVNTDPANYSAHRFLADSYAGLPRHGVARVSELLQSQLLQPINITPVQPELAEINLFIPEGAGPAEIGLNEYNPLFYRNRFAVLASAIAGSDRTFGDEVVQSGVWDRLSYSLGQLHYETAGFRPNNDVRNDIYDLFVQGRLSYQTSLQAELRHNEADEGDRGTTFFPEDFRRQLRQTRHIDTARLGFHQAFSPRSDIIASLIYQNMRGTISNIEPGVSSPDVSSNTSFNEKAYLIEGQYQFRSTGLKLITGTGHFNTIDRKERVTAIMLPSTSLPVREVTAGIEHTSAYIYSYLDYLHTVNFTLGISANLFRGRLTDHDQINPKFGLTWMPVSGTTLRAAAFRALEPGVSIAQTIEPTQIAGFNQFFGTSAEQDIENLDVQALDARQYGVGIDRRFSSGLYAGAEFSKRDVRVPGVFGSTPIAETWHEHLGRSYLYWSPHSWLSTSMEYQYERSERGELLTGGARFQQLETHRVPIGINFFHPSGFGADMKATWIDQSGVFLRTGVGLPNTPGADQFWVMDAALRYRLPGRLGLITLGVNNIFDKRFNFVEIDPTTRTVQRDRLIFGRITLSF